MSVGNAVDYVPIEEVKGRISATLALIYLPGIGVVVPGERWTANAQPMLDYFLAFEESCNPLSRLRLPGAGRLPRAREWSNRVSYIPVRE